jgi:hypothetical protein
LENAERLTEQLKAIVVGELDALDTARDHHDRYPQGLGVKGNLAALQARNIRPYLATGRAGHSTGNPSNPRGGPLVQAKAHGMTMFVIKLQQHNETLWLESTRPERWGTLDQAIRFTTRNEARRGAMAAGVLATGQSMSTLGRHCACGKRPREPRAGRMCGEGFPVAPRNAVTCPIGVPDPGMTLTERPTALPP